MKLRYQLKRTGNVVIFQVLEQDKSLMGLDYAGGPLRVRSVDSPDLLDDTVYLRGNNTAADYHITVYKCADAIKYVRDVHESLARAVQIPDSDGVFHLGKLSYKLTVYDNAVLFKIVHQDESIMGVDFETRPLTVHSWQQPELDADSINLRGADSERDEDVVVYNCSDLWGYVSKVHQSLRAAFGVATKGDYIYEV